MRHYTRLAVSAFAALTVLAGSVNAHAQEYYPPPSNAQPPPPPPPNGPPPPPSAQAPNGEYVAPLSQPTQQTYVPQSVAMSGPSRITDWDDSQPIPPGYHVKNETRKGLIIGGAVMFGVLYFFDLVGAAVGTDCVNSGNCGNGNPYTSLYVPAVGPFLQMAQNSSATGNVFLAVDGLAQCAGIAMFIYGIAAPRTVLVRNDLGISTPLLVPMKMGQDGYGAGLVARF